MPLTDLIRYFNLADTTGESTLYLDGKRAAAWHRGLRLGSLFQPIVDLRRERVVGHQARLFARREDGTAASAAEADCRPTHERRRVAYNLSSPSGALP